MKEVYLDNISGTPLHPEVIEVMLTCLKENYGNPQSLHSFGEKAKAVVDSAREKVASLINSKPEEVYFTSCGTESNNFAIKGLALASKEKGKHIVVSAIEHHSVLHSVKTLQSYGFRCSYVPVDKFGVVNPRDVSDAIEKDTVLVSVMFANSEVGTIQNISEIAQKVKEKGVIFHTDAVAAVGNIPVDVNKLNIDAMSFASNQFYGPKGVAGLYLKKGIRILPLLDGGIQEDGRRAGTENVPGIAGFGKAAEIAVNEMKKRIEYLSGLRDRLIKNLTENIDYIYLTGDPENRLPHHASFCVEFIEGEAMLLNLSMEGIAVSSGSACTSRALKASHVLTAMGIEPALAQGSIVFSFGMINKQEDIDYIVKIFPPIVKKLRQMSPVYSHFLRTGKRMPAGPGTDYKHIHEDNGRED